MQKLSDWKPFETAPKDRAILCRRHNDCGHEHIVLWWSGLDPTYPWDSENNSFPSDRWDEWTDIPA